MVVEPGSLNLLPPRLRSRRVLRRQRFLLAALVSLFLLLVSGYLIFLAELRATESSLRQVRAEWSQLTPELREAESIMGRKKSAHAIIKEYQTRIQEQQKVTPFLQDLGEILPVDIWLSQLEIGDRQVKKKSKQKERFFHLEGYASQPASVGVLLVKMQQLPYLERVVLLGSSSNEIGLKFKIEGLIKGVL